MQDEDVAEEGPEEIEGGENHPVISIYPSSWEYLQKCEAVESHLLDKKVEKPGEFRYSQVIFLSESDEVKQETKKSETELSVNRKLQNLYVNDNYHKQVK